MEILYILGNGFDLNMGLRTSYTDFYNYYHSLESTKENVKFLKESITADYKNWSDLELGLGNYTAKLKTTNEFTEIFEDITDQLAAYLENEENSFEFSLIDRNKLFSDLCAPESYLPLADANIITAYRNSWRNSNWHTRIITFNYTRSIERILGNEMMPFQIGTHTNSFQIKLNSIEHLHGYIDERMIMGVNDISQIKNSSFHDVQEIIEAMVKPSCNLASKSTIDKVCSRQIANANLICIFGCSMGDTDNIWWEFIGDQLRRDIKLIIFTRGYEISRRRPYKRLSHEREIKSYFMSKTSLTELEKERFGQNIIIALNSEIFSHMRIQT